MSPAAVTYTNNAKLVFGGADWRSGRRCCRQEAWGPFLEPGPGTRHSGGRSGPAAVDSSVPATLGGVRPQHGSRSASGASALAPLEQRVKPHHPRDQL